MKFPSRFRSPRAVRTVFTAWALLALSACLVNFVSVMITNVSANDQCAWRNIPGRDGALLITDIVPGGVADMAGVRNGDILLKINGKEFKGIDAQLIINAVPVYDYATYLVERGGQQLELKVQILRVFNLSYLAQFLLGFGFLVVGYVVVMTKPLGAIQRLFARYSILSMLFFGLAAPDLAGGRGQGLKFWIIASAMSIGHVFAPPMFVRFFSYFPADRPGTRKRWLTLAMYCISTAFLILLVIGGSRDQSIALLGFYVPYAFYIAGLLVFVHSYFTRLDETTRVQLRPILNSVVVGIITVAYAITLSAVKPFAVFLTPILFTPAVLIIGVPLAFGYSIFRYRLMDIDLIIKRSLIYGAVTATIAAVYLLIVYGVGNLIAYFMGSQENRFLNIFAFIFIALVFDPIKRRTQGWIDRVFYQERTNYQRALLEFSQDLPRQMNLEQILNSTMQRICDTMHVEKIAIVLCDENEGCMTVSRNIDTELAAFSDIPHGLVSLLRVQKGPQSLVFLEEDNATKELAEPDKKLILGSGIVLAVPMFLQDRLIGTINVGPKLSGRFYSQEDIDLLSTVAGQAAIAVENARLHRSEIEKQKIEEELAMARQIQQGLLPKENPSMAGMDIAGVSLPALSVGGDYFDFIRLGSKKLLVVVADVSGKGMSAALYMSKIQGMIQLAAHMYDSPREMLVHVNRRLYDGIERKSFITMILSLFDLDAGEVRICRAGHNKAIIGTNGSLHYLNSTGIGLGLERGPIFEQSLEEVRYKLQPDQVFLFYSDGLTEAMDEKQQQFGEEAICEIIRENRSRPALSIQDSLLKAVRAFQGSADQHDDITLVVAKNL